MNYKELWKKYKEVLSLKEKIDEEAKIVAKEILANMKNDQPLYKLVIFKMVELFKKEKIKKEEEKKEKYNKISQLLDMLNINNLEKNFDIPKNSHYQKWHTLKINALYQVEKFEECLELIEKVERESEIYEKEDYCEVIRKKYLIYGKSDLDEKLKIAINGLKELGYKNKKWYCLKEAADILFNNNELEKSTEIYEEILLSNKITEMFLNCLEKLAYIYYADDKELSKLCYKIIYFLRIEKKWPINTEKYEEKFEESFNLFDIGDKKNLLIDFRKKILKKRKSYFGKISILNKGYGFITSIEKKNYYFTLKNKNYLKVGDEVSFYLKKGFDFKKNKESEEAIYVNKIFGGKNVQNA